MIHALKAWNCTSATRYVLIVDVWAPVLTAYEIAALEMVRDRHLGAVG